MISKLAGLIFGAAAIVVAPARAAFVAGADCSLVDFFEARGISYKTNGQAGDPLLLLKSCGINCIRLRLFTSSAAQAQADPYDYTNNLDYTLPLAVRVKNAGLQFMLDFHYSDTWADPGHQKVPSGWTNLSFAQLVQQMRDYNSNSIAAFNAAGAMPDYVQLGNEIISGILWTNGKVGGAFDTPAQWSKLGQLLNAAVLGIKDAAGTNSPKIIVHIDRGGDWNGTKWFFDNLNLQGVPFDIIGESYYPFFHGSLTNLSFCLSNAAARYHKPILVAETAFPWTNSVFRTNIFGFTGTPDGQAQYTAALIQAVKNVTNASGVCWWSAEYQASPGVNEAGYNTTSFFDANGNLLPAATVLGQAAAPVLLTATLSDSNLNLSWPLSGTGMNLMTSTSIIPSAAWTPLTNALQNNSTNFNTTLPLGLEAIRFFRLQGKP